MTEEGRRLHERDKRDFLQIEDIKLGDGPLAAWGRKIRADIEVRYTDGTVAYRGPMFIYIGFRGDVFIHDATKEDGALSFIQSGIWLGINGMAVGGKRRITIERELVGDGLLVQGRRTYEDIGVRKEKLIVEATLLPLASRFFSEGPVSSERSVAVMPNNPNVAPLIPSGACTNPKKERADRLIATSPFSHTSFRPISPYNSPFAESTFPANRSSNIVA